MDKKETYLKLFRALINQLKETSDELGDLLHLNGFWKQYPQIKKMFSEKDNPFKKLIDAIENLDGQI